MKKLVKKSAEDGLANLCRMWGTDVSDEINKLQIWKIQNGWTF